MPPPAPLDQDDLDDLDDVLDQFSRQPDPSATSDFPTSPLTSPPPPPPSATTTTFGRQRTNTRVDAPPVPAGKGLAGVAEAEEESGVLAEDFAAELAKGMESLMREIAGEAAASGAGASGAAADDAALKAAWESMLIENMDGMSADKDKDKDKDKNKGDEPAGDFQATIRQAIGKLREGEAALDDASGAGAGAAPDSLEALLAQLGAAGEGDLPADEAELAGFLENMMGELMSKDVLYEPLKELADKLPPYLAHPPPALTPDDRARYAAQLERVRAILAVFDAPTFSDTDPKTRESVVALMAEMQSFGSPPAELMGPLPPGLGALGEDGCVVA